MHLNVNHSSIIVWADLPRSWWIVRCISIVMLYIAIPISVIEH